MRHRLEFLDFLRFVAAFAVLLQHGGEKLSPFFREISYNYFQFGVFGVTVFFLCSGFIIPVSLEKHGSLKKFWIGRIFRLFPLYYVSLIATLALISLGLMADPFPSLKVILWNTTMLMRLVGQPCILGLYWTLSLEMVFYLIVSGLFILRMLSKTVVIAVGALLFCFAFGVIAVKVLHFAEKGWGTAFYLATMFTGSVIFKHYDKKISTRTLLTILGLAMCILVANTYANLYGRPNNPEDLGIFSFVPVTSALVSAYLLFMLGYFFRNKSFNPVFLRLGVVSYSLYLTQGLIFKTVPQIPGQPVLTFVMWIALIVGISFITYRYIEYPFLQLGKTLTSKKQTPIPGILASSEAGVNARNEK
ncbi:MAG: acyltransferase [Dyadobacter sp.]|uniref:acyltransferase family protein n=1 Tax=Dyadobacter sp. TaxID=1914288 RepID=UPI001B1A8099|nr:acyltransferase [Dyadobacter sp.]MBO9616378.1 acyltransferase [Dyadobacter sp.]